MKCNRRPTVTPPQPVYFRAHANRLNPISGEPVSDPGLLASLPTDRLLDLIGRIRAAAAEVVEPLATTIYDHPVLRDEICRCSRATPGANLRHLEQQASLVGTMHKEGLLEPGGCFAEFGAGRGKLLHFVRMAVGEGVSGDYLAIDRKKTRCNFDRFHSNTEESRLERAMIDIEHLDLERVPIVQTGKKPLVVFGKHLCGCATDLTLVCTTNSFSMRTGKASCSTDSREKGVRGITIALCCHQVGFIIKRIPFTIYLIL